MEELKEKIEKLGEQLKSDLMGVSIFTHPIYSGLPNVDIHPVYRVKVKGKEIGGHDTKSAPEVVFPRIAQYFVDLIGLTYDTEAMPVALELEYGVGFFVFVNQYNAANPVYDVEVPVCSIVYFKNSLVDLNAQEVLHRIENPHHNDERLQIQYFATLIDKHRLKITNIAKVGVVSDVYLEAATLRKTY